MSESLERVIAEQQNEIDLLRMQVERRDSGWVKHHEKLEKFIGDVFALLNNPESEGIRNAVKFGLQGFNYCLTCEQSPCECEGQDI